MFCINIQKITTIPFVLTFCFLNVVMSTCITSTLGNTSLVGVYKNVTSACKVFHFKQWWAFELWFVSNPSASPGIGRIGVKSGDCFKDQKPKGWNFSCMELNFITVLGWPLLKDLTLIKEWEFCRHQPPALFIFALESMQRKKRSKFY